MRHRDPARATELGERLITSPRAELPLGANSSGTLQWGGHRFERGSTPLRTVVEKLLAG